MVICEACGREMLTADGCDCTHIEIDGELYPRIKYGDPGDLSYGYPQTERCPDCACRLGNYHHPGCDTEACPKCGLQLISCGCAIGDLYGPE